MSIESILARLKHTTGIDFTNYKESTLRRQLQRRMAISGCDSVDDYLILLSDETSEVQALAHNLLVSVTSFFRNPDAFAALAKPLRQLINGRRPGERLRVWVPGCATGEEVYSIAMCVSDAMGHPANLAHDLKIFATDLDESSLAIARRAVYPLSSASTIPTQLFDRFALKSESSFEFNKELRACIVFARHNLCEDPPFPNIDLISCRNTLIYSATRLSRVVSCCLVVLNHSARPRAFRSSTRCIGSTPEPVSGDFRAVRRWRHRHSAPRLAAELYQTPLSRKILSPNNMCGCWRL
jgi:two-component system CheB/CheR fusion protein